MPIPRPKILTAVTVPAGGWAFKSDVSVAAQYDTTCDVTVAAGTYFVAGDNQSDDLLFALQTAIQTRLTAIGGSRYVAIWLDPDSHKVQICFCGAGFIKGAAHVDDVRIDWPTCDSGLYNALGFDGMAIDASTSTDEPLFSADWQQSHGWYADEDGQLASIGAEDSNIATSWQATSLSGRTKSQLVGDRYANSVSLQFLERSLNGKTKVFSRGVSYGSASVYPYERNQPIECWWREARQGTRFRVYTDGYVSTSKAVFYDSTAGVSASVFDLFTNTLDTDPQRMAGAYVWLPDIYELFSPGGRAVPQGFYVSSHTASRVTLANAMPAVSAVPETLDGLQANFFDHRYQTYVLDLDEMSTFAPDEIPTLDRYNITIPLKRYVA